MSIKFQVRVLTPCYVGGERVLPGQQLSVTAEVAADLLRAGRVVLVNADDLKSIALAGREAEIRFASQTRERGAIGDGNPWR